MATNVNNAKRFSEAVQKVANQLKTDYEKEARRLSLTIFARVVARTPVDFGFLRNNWQLTLNAPATSEKGGTDPTGTLAITEAQQVMTTFKAGDGIWLSNNLPYAAVWEYGKFVPANPGPSADPRPGRFGVILVANGFSLQAPQGMLGVTLEEVIGGIL